MALIVDHRQAGGNIMFIVTLVQRSLSLVSSFFEFITAVILTVMLTINAINIFLRTVSGNAIDWVWPWTMFLFVIWVLIAFFPLYHLKKDVSIYFMIRNRRPVLQRFFGGLTYLVIAAAMLVILVSGPSRLAEVRGTIEIVNLPRVTLVIPLLLSASLIFIDALLNLFLIAAGRVDYLPFGKVKVS